MTMVDILDPLSNTPPSGAPVSEGEALLASDLVAAEAGEPADAASPVAAEAAIAALMEGAALADGATVPAALLEAITLLEGGEIALHEAFDLGIVALKPAVAEAGTVEAVEATDAEAFTTQSLFHPAAAGGITTTATVQTAADAFRGSGEVIVVIDDGYSDFYDQSNTIFGYDFSGFWNDADASVDTFNSHGSWVAQAALAEASEAGIIHLKVFADDGETASLSDIEEALQFVIMATSVVNVAAVNLSLGSGNTTSPAFTSLSDEFATLSSLGVINIAAAGNQGREYADGVSVLAADPNVVAVSAVDSASRLADFSQASDTLTDVAATGVAVPIETITGATGTVDGTSFAAPEVAGIAARLSEASWELLGENLTDDEFIDILNRSGSTVTDNGQIEPYVDAQGDAAVAFFIDNLALYDDPFIA